MGMYSTAVAVKNFVLESMDGFTADNCSVGDESVFAYIQENSLQSYKCCIITPETDNLIKLEMGGGLYAMTGSINGFFMISNEDYMSPQIAAYGFMDELRLGILRNPNLDRTVMRAKITSVGPLMTYQRGNYYYYIAPLDYEVLENLE